MRKASENQATAHRGGFSSFVVHAKTNELAKGCEFMEAQHLQKLTNEQKAARNNLRYRLHLFAPRVHRAAWCIRANPRFLHRTAPSPFREGAVVQKVRPQGAVIRKIFHGAKRDPGRPANLKYLACSWC